MLVVYTVLWICTARNMASPPPTLRELALRWLRDRITSGELAPGARLSDLVLSKEIGISRTPVREAIQQLAADGLVEVVPHAGATVRRPNASELEELYEIRGVLEGHAAARAAGACTPAQADELRAICAGMEAIPLPADGLLSVEDSVRQREIDLAFHRRVLELSGLARLRRLVEDAGVIARPFEAMRGDRLSGTAFAEACRHHRAITDAIAARDAEGARAAMGAHIASGRAGIRERLAAWTGGPSDAIPSALRRFV